MTTTTADLRFMINARLPSNLGYLQGKVFKTEDGLYCWNTMRHFDDGLVALFDDSRENYKTEKGAIAGVKRRVRYVCG